MPSIREGFDLEPTQDPARKMATLRKIGGITELSDAFARLMRDPRVCSLLREIMGDQIQLFRDVVMMKPALVGREKPWHQDSVYWPWQPMELVSAMTALDDSDQTNGCLQIIPRSHKRELQHYGKELQIDVGELQDQTFYVPLQAGDTLLFHSLLLHASETNRSSRDRRAVIISYKTPKLRYVGQGNPGDTPTIEG
jgi:ectoine hydroxylase-related dioxygenase (phytanoyl-CoA dioxygenase family)